MKVNLRPGKMSDTYPIAVNAQRLIITNWSGTNCKASATFYPERKGYDTFDFINNGTFLIDSNFNSVSFYWIDCSDDVLSFDFETE
jgi:hypothetical protein